MSRLIVSNIETQNIKFDSDTTAFTISSTGATSGVGAGSMVKLLDVTIGSVSAYDIDSTYINSTYDSYIINAYFLPNGDNKYLMMQVFVGGSLQTGSIYGYETNNIGSGNQGGGNSEADFGTQQYGSGNGAGEGTILDMLILNVNSSVAPFSVSGFTNNHNTDPNHGGSTFGGLLKSVNRADIVNGLRFKFHSGDISSGTLKLYGIK